MDISARALLVNTKVRVWTGEKRDKTITRGICDMKGAENTAVRANKSLLGEHIHGVQAAERAVRQAVNERTLPWMDDGTRILNGSVYLAFREAMAEPIRAAATPSWKFALNVSDTSIRSIRRNSSESMRPIAASKPACA